MFIINVALGVLVYTHSDKYLLTNTQIENITKVLTKNNVMLYTPIIKEYKPMKPINIQPYIYSHQELIDIFFDDSTKVNTVQEYGRDIYTDQISTLTIENGIIFFETQPTEKVSSEIEQKEYCNTFILNNNELFTDFNFDKKTEINGNLCYEYVQNYQGELIFSNYLVFIFDEVGLKSVAFSFSKISGFDDKAREICPADEALFVFMQYFRNNYGEREVFIDRMDIVYYQEQLTGESSTALKATPCYRFYLSDVPEPFLIDAYSTLVK